MTTLPEYGAPAWWRPTRSLLALVALTVAVVSSPPDHHWSGVPLTLLVVCLPIGIAGWLGWRFATPGSHWANASIVAAALAGLVLGAVQPYGLGLVFPAVACTAAGTDWPVRWSVPFAAVLGSAFVVARSGVRGWSLWALIGPGALALGLLMGLVRRQSARLAQESALARDEQARAAALGERAHLAREIHDVLAHTLSALSVQLETADALLETDRSEQARECVSRASQLAREGLVETRRAIGALRGETVPLRQMLDQLATGYRTDLGAPATVDIDGDPRELDPEATLTLYRTAQEAMTNVRKHAPGAPVTVELSYRSDDVRLRVVNGCSPAAVRPLAATGGGYGLSGLRERAELCGGVLTAEPIGSGYRVEVRLAR
jgi:signal transduction histidine kinase